MGAWERDEQSEGIWEGGSEGARERGRDRERARSEERRKQGGGREVGGGSKGARLESMMPHKF